MRILAKFRTGRIWDGIQDILGALFLVAGLIAAYGVVLTLLWNWTMPGWVGAPTIAYLQSCGVVAICHLLFKSNPLQKKSFDYDAIPIMKKLISLSINESKLVGDPPKPGLRR